MTSHTRAPLPSLNDPRRIPFDITQNDSSEEEDLFGNGVLNELAVHSWKRDHQPRRFRVWLKAKQWWRHHKHWLKPDTYYHRLLYVLQRVRRGYSEWDLDQFFPQSLRMTIAAIDFQATRAWTYPGFYVNEPLLKPENPEDNPDWGRGFEGYYEDLGIIKDGFEHWLASIEDREVCSCCNAGRMYLCKGMGCPIIAEAWALYTRVYEHMWD